MSGPFAFRGPDGEIDLEEALGPHLRHYVAVMVSGANGTRMQVLALGRTETPHGTLLRQGFGRPARASSCAEVVRQPGWSWDVCAYYLLLGVRWTASKREIRRAYKAIWRRSGGVQEERLTYAVSMLTDDRVRRAYDLVPLGGVFLRDRDTAERLKKAAVAEAVRRMAEEGEEAVTADEVLEEMGLRKEQPQPEGDDQPQEEAPPPAQEAPGDRWGARWGHYVLSGPQGAPRSDAALLEAWQGLVAAVLRERGISMGFAVGVGAVESPKVLRDINEPCIFIMTEKGASPDKARDAVEMGISLGIVENATGRHLHGHHAKGHPQGREDRGRAEVRRLLPGQDRRHEGRRGTLVLQDHHRPGGHADRGRPHVLRHQAQAGRVHGRQLAARHAGNLHERPDVPDLQRRGPAHRRLRRGVRGLLHPQPGPWQGPRGQVQAGQVPAGHPDLRPGRRPGAHPRRPHQAPHRVPGLPGRVQAPRRDGQEGPALRDHLPEAPQLLERPGGLHIHGQRAGRLVRLQGQPQGQRLHLQSYRRRPGALPGQRRVEALHRCPRTGRVRPRRGDPSDGLPGLVRPLVRRGRDSEGRLRPQRLGRGHRRRHRRPGGSRQARPGDSERIRRHAQDGPHAGCRLGLTDPGSPGRRPHLSPAGASGPGGTMAFADLHVHSEYSVLDGLSTTAEIARQVAENGGSAAALTDHGGCSGHVQWQRDALAAGISPVFGIETYFQPDRIVRPAEGDKEAQARLRGGTHLILLAQSDRGLHDLWAASTEAYASGFYHKPRMDWDVLEEYGSDLIATTACLGGIISQDLLAAPGNRAKLDEVLATVRRLKSVFRDRLFLEVQANELPEQRRLNVLLAELSAAFEIPMIAACDAHYPSPAEGGLHREWMACQSGKGKDDYWHFSPMLPEAQVRELLGYLDPRVVDKAIWNTTEVAARCDARIGGYADPPVFTPGGTAADDARALREMCERNWGLVEALGREYRDRMEREFEVVTGKGLAGCYLIVEDLIRFARSQGRLVGPGRGSAAGSLISYLLGITSVDPIRSGLLFERFLTKGREALPDFDLDFASSARTPIQDYAVEKYGADHVVRVGTIMRYGAKGIIKKLAAVRGGDEVIADAALVSKLIEQAEAGTAGLGLPWDEVMQDPEITEVREKYPEMFAVAERLQGRVYAQGQHPAGLIISPGRVLTGAMPMRHAKPGDKMLVSQWDYRAAEDLNLLKLDILTLRTLDTAETAIRLVEERTGIRLDPRSWDIEHLDPQVYDAVDTGQTLGVFQLETRLCSEYSRRMRPRTLAHLADLTTFIRPGPRNSGATERYLARFLGTEPVEYAHPLLEELLSSTYGVMLYQEQVMQACMILAGYSELEADGVRKILGKKLVSKVEAAGEEFTRRAVERGHDEEQMRALWSDMSEFGRYAFNKSHGFSYGVLSYWCVGGQTRIYDWDKREYVSIAKAYRQGITTTACYDPSSGKTVPGRVSAVVRTTGAKNKDLKFGWRMTTSSRKKLTCSERHLILTPYGYKRLEEIEVGDLVAAEKRHSQSGREDVRQAISGGVRRSWAASTEESRKRQVKHLSAPAARESRLASWRTRYEQKTPEEKYERVRPFIEAAAESAGRLGTAPCGAVTHSPDEGTVCRWLMGLGVTHEHQVALPSGKIADFRIKGVFVEVQSQTWPRSAEYWEQKYGDEPYVLTDALSYEDDLHWVTEEGPMRAGADVTWEEVTAIDPVGDMVMYDIIMEGEPHNFLANGIVVHNTAWLKEHYPAEFLTAVMSTVDMDRLPEFAMEGRRLGLTVLPPDVSYCQGGFTCQGITVRYGLLAIPTVGEAAVKTITRAQPYDSYADFLARSGANAGVTYALAKAGALDSLVPSRKGLLRVIESDRDGTSVRCVHKTDEEGGPGGLPCGLDWEADQAEQEGRHAVLMAPRLAEGRKPLKLALKLPPARCTRACRRYTPPSQPGMAAWGEYPPDALFRADMEAYGTWMSEAVWDRLDQLSPGLREQAREMGRLLVTAAPGAYPVAAVVAGVHSAVTRTGNAMWWVKLLTEVSVLDLACFSPRREEDLDVPAMVRRLRQGTLVQAEIRKRSYMSRSGPRMGWNLTAAYPLG